MIGREEGKRRKERGEKRGRREEGGEKGGRREEGEEEKREEVGRRVLLHTLYQYRYSYSSYIICYTIYICLWVT